METPRNTGLGNSLLLRRTETPPSAESAVSADTQPPDVSSFPEQQISAPSTTEAALPKSTSKKPQKEQLVLRDKTTLYLEREVNEQLRVVARIEGRQRSDVASEILRMHLPKYRIEREQ